MTKETKSKENLDEDFIAESPQEDTTTNENDVEELAEEIADDSQFQEEDPSEEDGTDIEKIKADLQKANDKYLRLHAEFDNYRRRTAKESLGLVATANAQLITKQCEILDNFDRAFVEENKAPDLESFEKGMKMIYDNFSKVLEESGLTTINPTDTAFNPSEHEALMQQPSEDIEEDNIITVFQKGYKLNDKVLRHAKVIVSSGPAAEAEA